ncbi:signal transduction histidine kinase/CheY-like chemotaxis protein [Pedobacter cryoconitis]|uniref:ATP-binding protein n=1 Tax=Pedobacter cryoconitis TaxID=188932 RepID=UPI001621DE66|nr:ATP-binding protein [Pedobacter cryoconitis]MBB6270141.1 signal transduction histidine kinase/CheY-like chemotaxis protein [Pedobacter cryoconitis]
MKNKQVSFIAILVIIAFFIVLLVRTSFTQYTEQKVLQATSLQRDANNEQLHKLDTINMGLQEAENNFRMYTSLWEKKYFIKYSQGIKHVSFLLESFSKEDLNNVSTDISNDISKRNKQILLYAKIKKMTDSLMSVNLLVDTSKTSAPASLFKPSPRPVIKKITKTEVVAPAPEVKKTKFFQRLKSAILNKENKKDTAKTSKIETVIVETSQNDNVYTKKQIDDIEKFYQNLFEKQRGNHKLLTENERSILKLNEQILENIKLMFREFSDREYALQQTRKMILRDKTKHSLEVIGTSGKINFLINVFSIVVIISLLITLYRAYNRIVQANKLASEQVIVKSRFFTSISHEMRTPLNAILGATEQLKTTPLNPEQGAMANLLETSSSMLLSAVNEILDFSRLETGKLSLSKTPFLYKSILHEIVAATAVLANQKGLKLILNQKDAPDLSITGDPYRLKQIMVNLIANAIKFTDKGEVVVKVTTKHTETGHILLLIEVSDTGIGISEKELPLIFDEFSQVINNKRMDWQKGSGLGLPICKKLVDLHHGKITVNSTLGKGSTFYLELPYPLAEQTQDEQADNEGLISQADRFKNIHLLVVDDANMNLLVIKMIFNKLNISFDTATNGEDALKAFDAHHYDMVLTDIEMPGMNGLELTQKIRAHQDENKCRTPIIAITGQISPESHQNYISSGLNDYLVKPYKESELLEKILDYLP